jgi:multisubunit Na+/H+ antiporter MnhC subunit
MQMKKLIFFVTVIVLFLAALFLDQNSSPVPVKIILGNPRPIGLSAIIITSILVGVALTLAALFLFKTMRKAKKNQQDVEVVPIK